MPKIVVQKMTGLEETCVVEIDVSDVNQAVSQLPIALKALDARLAQTNAKIVEVREFMAQVKDPNYRYLFITFLDSLLGISSNAESLLRKFGIVAPVDFDKWLADKDSGNKPELKRVK